MDYFICDFLSHSQLNNNYSRVIDYLITFKLIMKKLNKDFPNIFYIEWCSYLLPKIDKKIFRQHITLSCETNMNHVSSSSFMLFRSPPLQLNYSSNSNSYYEFININLFISKYNVKYKLFKYLNSIYKDVQEMNKSEGVINNNQYLNNDIYCILDYEEDYFEKRVIVTIKFIKKYKFIFLNSSIHHTITTFFFKLPIDFLINVKNTKFTENKLTDKVSYSLFPNAKRNTFKKFDELMTYVYNDNNGICMDYYMESPNIIQKIIYFELFKKVVFRLSPSTICM